MRFDIFQVQLDKSAGTFRRALQYAFYNWRRDMPRSKRLVTLAGFLIQVGALSLAVTGKTKPFMFLAVLVYVVGLCLVNGMLTAEFVR